MSLRDLEFTDLILTRDPLVPAVLKGVPEQPLLSMPPGDVKDELEQLWRALEEVPGGRMNFSLQHDGVSYRAARMHTVGGLGFALRRARIAVPALDGLGLPSGIVTQIRDPRLRSGLIFVSGSMGSGKTTAAAAIIVDRLARGVSGHAHTIEDPPELPLQGWHGGGMCLQEDVPDGRFGVALKEILRKRPDVILLGELRDSDSMSEALRAGLNGHLIITTVHSESVTATLQRVSAFAGAREGTAAPKLLGSAFRACLHLDLATSNGKPCRKVRSLFALDDFESSIRSMIEQEKFSQIESVAQQQLNLIVGWASQRPGRHA